VRILTAVLVAFLVAACGSTVPGTVAPTIAALEQLGLDCGDGLKDNVPSGLYQWSCAGTIDDERVTVLVDGNDEGVSAVELFIDESTDPALARRLFERLVDAVPPLSTAPILKTVVADWDGPQRSQVLGGVRVTAMCLETPCSVLVMPAHDALRPLPLP
jgi:hypothetical protein